MQNTAFMAEVNRLVSEQKVELAAGTERIAALEALVSKGSTAQTAQSAALQSLGEKLEARLSEDAKETMCCKIRFLSATCGDERRFQLCEQA